MSSLPADLGIWALLFIGIVFCGIGLMGLMIFPDTKSRMFTAFRATAIGFGAVIAAVLTYGLSMLQEYGGSEYVTLIVHTHFLAAVLAAGTWVMYRIIRDRTSRGSSGKAPATAGTNAENGE
jgi:multisubunit Na+/H+ antiporter MnhG subunit